MQTDYGRWEILTPSLTKPISLDEFKNFRNLPLSVTNYDNEYQLYIDSSIRIIERFLNYNLLTTEWNYYLHSFENIIYDYYFNLNYPSNYITVYNKGNIQDILSIHYLKNDTWEEIPTTDFKFVKKPIHESVLKIFSNDTFQADYDAYNNFQIECVRIKAQIGFDSINNIPSEIKLALLQLASNLFDSKGLCEYNRDLLNKDTYTLIENYRANKLLF